MSKKSDNFIRLAESRTNKIINMIGLLGNLSNKSFYEYSDEQIEQIFDSIEEELKIQKIKFKSRKRKERFKL